LNPAVARLLLPYLITPFVIGAGTLALWWRTPTEPPLPPERPDNPLQLVPALQMAALFQLVLFAVGAAGRVFGNTGLLFSGAVLGLTDVDALTISMTTTRVSVEAPATAAAAIAIGVVANCLLKATLAAALGTAAFRRVTTGLLVGMAAAIAVSLLAF
jgi:uncharacterized membrane protein (DUF4010 family)